jgi:hypothetical protein
MQTSFQLNAKTLEIFKGVFGGIPFGILENGILIIVDISFLKMFNFISFVKFDG